jgi:hypothetical protein
MQELIGDKLVIHMHLDRNMIKPMN